MTFLARDGANVPMSRVFVPGTNRNVTTSATSARTAADFDGSVKVVRLVASAACYIAFGDDTVAATSAGILMPADMECFFALPSDATRVAAIQVSAGGVLSVTEMR